MDSNVTIKIDALDNSKAAFAALEKNLEGVKSASASVATRLEEMAPTFRKIAAVGTVAFAGLVAAGTKSIQAYAEVERAQRQLEHAVIAVSKGTRQQVTEIETITAALEKKSGVDADSLKMGAAQLSTFGLHSSSVVALTKSLADLTVNQSGLNATSEDYIQSANNIAKALNGQFGVLERSGIRFTEAQQNLILYGTETQKVAALQEGFAQNLRETTDTVAGVDLAMAKLRRTTENISENMGKALTPAFSELARTVQPIIERFAEWSDKNPELVATIVKLTAAVAALAVIVGTLGLAIGILLSPITLVVAALAATAAAVYIVATRWQQLPGVLKLLLLPIKLTIEWFKTLYETVMWAANGISNFLGIASANIGTATGTTARYVGNLQGMVDGLIDPMAGQSRVVEGFGTSISGLGGKATEAAEKIKALKEEAAGIFDDVGAGEADSKRQLAETIVAQEQGISEKKRELRRLEKSEDSDSNATRVQELRAAIREEEASLRGSRDLKLQLRAEVDEAERRASLTDFQRKIEDIQAERVARLEAQLIRLQEIQEEIAAERAKSGAIASAFNAAQSSMQSAIAKTREIAETEAERIKKAFDRAISSMNQLSGGKAIGGSLFTTGTSKLTGKATGGPVSGKTPYIVGEVGPELFVPNSAGRIIPNNQLATASNSNVYVTITGNSFMGERDMAERVGDQIIRLVKQNARL